MKTRIKKISLILVAAASLAASLVQAAATVDPTTQPAWNIGAFTLKQPNLQLGATNAYRTWFENGAWQGDVIEYDIDAAGNRSTDVTVGANPATDGINNWSARYEFDTREATVTDYWKAANGRKIITYNTDSGSQVAFRWDTLSSIQQAQVDPGTATAGLTGSYASPVLNFIRGDRSQETPGGLLRKRHNLLGDPGKVQPVYTGAPAQSFPIPGHAQYMADNASRAGRVIVAANDGMIHVFDADTGIEVYAYVPSMLFPALNRLTKVGYVHTWFADGQLAIGDAKIGTAWKTLVAGGLGAGARGLFALDVTNPALGSETSATAADTKVLWEQTGSTLGYIHGKPGIAPLSNGTWYVISGNGYGSTNDMAILYMAPVDGSTPVTIATDLTTGNGLSAPALVDTDGDAAVDIAYAGDLLGNLWKFDLDNPGTAAELLFSAGVNKPITTAPDVAVHPNGGYLVYIATGSLLSAADAADTSQQTVYAIWDYPNRTGTITDGTVTVNGTSQPTLVSQTLSIDTYVDPNNSALTTSVRLATGNTPNWSYNRGWKTDLSANSGERVVGDIQLRGNRVQFATDLPTTNETNPTGESWLLELDWLSGGDINAVFFDLNNDGVLNNSDKVALPDTSLVVPVGTSLGQGNRSQPAFARVANGADTIFINGVNLDVFTCEGVCQGGLQGGHVDVDTDTPAGGLGGSTNAHIHQYDIKYNVTFMNYFDLEPPNGSTLEHVDQVGIGANTKFVVILANADLSPGGRIVLGNKEWNVVDYQEMIQQRLLNYDGVNSSTLVDEVGDSLVFTLQSMLSSSGTMEISFKDTAIISGGLHPTQTSCVKSQLTITNGRWRNGALTIHLIRLDTIGSGGSSNNTWVAQSPTDLAAGMVGGGLHANQGNNTGFLYESTLFWHFGELSKLLNGTKPCYGDPGYAAAVTVEQTGLTLAEFSAMFPNYALQQDYIDSLADQLTTYTCAKGVGKDCKKEQGYKNLEGQLNGLVGDVKSFLKLKYYLRGGSGSGGVGDSSNGNVAAGVDGKGDSEDDAVYTATPTGRISWIDLRP